MAKKHRLRRLCERKPSGKLNVPEAIHLAWKRGGTEADDLLKLLEASDWDKDWSPKVFSVLNFFFLP